MKPSWKSFLLSFLAFTPLIIWASAYINQDIWYDEVYSFEQFVFQDWKTTVTDYSAPNNHIFHNLVLQTFSRSIGIRDAMALPEFIFLFRLLELLISLGTASYLVKLGRLHFPSLPAYLILLCLFSTLAFANYQIQIRGYALSCFLLSASTYYVFTLREKYLLKHLIYLVLSSMLLLYTIPSNLYALASLGILILGLSLLKIRIEKRINTLFLAALGILGGTVLAAFLYLPIAHQLLNNEFALAKPETPFFVFSLVPILLKAFISSRYILLLSIPLALFYWLRGKSPDRNSALLLLLLLILPLCLAFIHQSLPFDRVFMVLSPWFALFAAASLNASFVFFKNRQLNLIKGLAVLSLLFAFITEYLSQKEDVAGDLYKAEILRQDVYRNYYWGDFYKPGQTIKFIGEELNDDIHLMASDLLDWPAHYLYLRKYKLDCPRLDASYYLQSLDTLQGETLLLTSFPLKKEKELQSHGYKGSAISRNFNFTQGILVKP